MARDLIVKLPRTGRRNQPAYCKLLYAVRGRGFSARFEGKLLRAGSTIGESELRPGPEYPERPVVLEYASSEVRGWGHRRAPALYVVWTWDGRRWAEAARVASEAAEWIQVLEDPIRRLLCPCPAPVDAIAASERVMERVEEELDGLADEERRQVLSVIYDRVAARIVA